MKRHIKLFEEYINEGNAFIFAAAKAKKEGKKEFEFNGKTYKVTLKADTGLKESTLNEADVAGEWVVYLELEKSRGKKLLGTFKSGRAAKSAMNAKINKEDILNQDGVESIGSMTKKEWDETEAKYAVKESIDLNESTKTENAFKELHFETDPKKFKLMVDQLRRDTSWSNDDFEYMFKRFRKSIGEEGLGAKPYPAERAAKDKSDAESEARRKKEEIELEKKRKRAAQWNKRKYDSWIKSVAANGGAEFAHDMAQNARWEPGLIQYVDRNLTDDESALDRIQWDIEALAESDNTILRFNEFLAEGYHPFKGKTARDLHKALLKINRKNPEDVLIYTSTDESPYNIFLDDLLDDLTSDTVTLYGDDGESIDSEVVDIVNLENM